MLTALSVAWGIFMLVVLLGSGQGLSNGVQAEFARDATNSVWVSPRRFTKPYKGQPVGKVVRFTNQDFTLMRNEVPVVEWATVRVSAGDLPLVHGQRHGVFSVRGVLPDHLMMEKSVMVRGRYLNDADQRDRRKVAVIGVKVREQLFAGGAEPIGATVRVGTAVFQVVGVFDEPSEEEESLRVYIPASAAQIVFAGGERLDQMAFTVGDASAEATGAAVKNLRRQLAARHGFAPDDNMAVWVSNNHQQAEEVSKLFKAIRAFVWIIGLGTILAGVVGVSNIMLISVQERTREIGIRKAIGAPPATIVAMIVEEALLVTVTSGYLGLLAGVGTLALAQRLLPPMPFFLRPEVDLKVALGATLVLVLAGVTAGLFPALRAARINPIAALRVE